MNTEQRIREIRKGTLKWYPFREGASVLFVGKETDPLFEMLEDMKLAVDCLDAEEIYNTDNFYDYIIAVESLEVLRDVPVAISHLSEHLSKNGHMILGFNNRLGTRYFFGDRDPYTKQNFDGVENYRRAYSKREDRFFGKCYDKATLVDIFEKAGLNHQNYSILPDFSNVQLILRDDYESNEDFSIRVFPTYNHPKTVFLEEEFIYNSLQDNKMLHPMANCLLFDCTFSEGFLDVLQVTSSMGRDEEDSFFTVIQNDNTLQGDNRTVKKIPAYPEGKKKLDDMLDISDDLKAHSLSVVDMSMDSEGNLSMPYISAPTAHVHLRQCAMESEERFLEELDKFVELIRQSSDVVSGEWDSDEGVTVARGCLDLMPLNCFYIDGEYVFFDQEFVEDNYPINAIICRAVASTSGIISDAKLSVSYEDLLTRYGLYENREEWEKMYWEFLIDLRHEKELKNYIAKNRYDSNQVYSNRVRMNFSSEEYLRRFVNVFQGIDNKKVIIFGTGGYAKQFMKMYGKTFNIDAVVDNNKKNQGNDFFGIKVSGAEILEEYENRTYRVIICIKNFLSVVKQLEDMGVDEYGIFDPNQVYQKPRKSNTPQGVKGLEDSVGSKKYHTGYIAGVFDLFHVGHLEKFKLAKEQCDYLIVGLVTDEGVIKNKKTTPFVPFEERKAMLEACKYVDEVVEIPLDFAGTREAWRMYGFDVQFSGSDYVEDEWWLAEKEFLEQHGVDMVFFPYTESTSSSKLKALIEEKLI